MVEKRLKADADLDDGCSRRAAVGSAQQPTPPVTLRPSAKNVVASERRLRCDP